MKPLDILTLPLTTANNSETASAHGTAPAIGGTVCIEASAGTGKTYAIGLIALRLVMEDPGIDLAKLAVVTFTDAATGELAERIGEFLRIARDYASGAASSTPGHEEIQGLVDAAFTNGKNTVLRRLDEALLNYDLARISTIHGFCSRILNEFAFETHSSFGMDLIRNQDEVVHQILSDFWRREIAPLEPRIYQFVEGITPQLLYEEFKGLMAFPGIEVKGPAVKKRDMEEFFASYEVLCSLWKDSRASVLELLNVPKRFKGKYKTASDSPDAFSAFAGRLDACFDGETADLDTIRLLAFDALDGQIYVAERKKFSLPRLPIFIKAQEFLERFGSFPESFAASVKVRAYAELTAELKKRLAALRVRSFNSMISDLADSLRGEFGSPASLIRQKFTAVLVDEFQDTDALQYTIFHSLFFGRDDVFFAMIGDPKQAIYRFRGGDINTYVRARNQVPEDRRFTLANNYRSERRLIDAINRIYTIDNPSFDHTGPFLTPEIGYTKVSPMRNLPSPTQGGRIVPPVTLWTAAEGVKPNDHVVGKRIAATITELMDPDEPLIIGVDEKHLRLSDIAILVSSHHSASVFKKILTQSGIRSVIAKSGSVFQSDEAEELILLMHVILDPSKEGAVRALLTSSLYRYDIDALTEWERDDTRRIAMLKELHEAKARWASEGIAPAISHVLNGTGIFALSDDPKDELTQERRITNFRHLLEILHIEDLRVGKVPERLMSEFLRMKIEADEAPDDDEMEQRLESDYDAVQIFTMHKAKGLQWPVVFAPDLYKDSKKRGASFIYYDEEGVRKADLQPDMQEVISEEVEREMRQERMRLAYVTLTRAESLLFAVTADKPEKSPAALLLRAPALAGICDTDGPLFKVAELSGVDEPAALKTVPNFTRARAIAEWDRRRELKAPWSIGSYSGLTRGLSQERKPVSPAAMQPEGIFAFPKGAEAGTALHTVFEKIDFMDAARITDRPPNEIVQLVEGVLTDNGISPRREPENVDRVIGMIKKVMLTNIPEVGPGFRLGDLRADDRLTELEFHISAGHPEWTKQAVTGEDLKKIIGPKAERISEGKKLNGFLNGFIDLVFRHRGKWFIVDWKSNHLGYSADCYSREAMEEAMREHNYYLQYHIYTVALVRYLAGALDGGFDYARDFGGIIYIFLRGVDGTGNGVFFELPDQNIIMSLEKIL